MSHQRRGGAAIEESSDGNEGQARHCRDDVDAAVAGDELVGLRPVAGQSGQTRAVLGDSHPDLSDDQGPVPVALPRNGRADEVVDAPLPTGPSRTGPRPHVPACG